LSAYETPIPAEPLRLLPLISPETLLGKYTGGSCGHAFIRHVLYDKDKKFYRFRIGRKLVVGLCSGPGNDSLNFIAIPKIPSDHTVSFEVYEVELTDAEKKEILSHGYLRLMSER
jgi:hypothetical protein